MNLVTIVNLLTQLSSNELTVEKMNHKSFERTLSK